jgi:ectoine hydroxylase-related dioxygenase (phytanoyl-CoA dioxygenase family)
MEQGPFVGVLLSDLPNPHAGNFTVCQGSHLVFEQYFREHGPESLIDGMPPVKLSDPKQITGQAGDIVLCHYQLAHGIAPNVSPHIRYATFFRLTHIDHHLDWKAPMTNLWLHWSGMREILPE